MTLTLGKDLISQQSIRQLNRTSDLLSNSLERLSSGQRINRAQDDAASLAISMNLGTRSRVYTQAVRNANDGISALNIAGGALSQLESITYRQLELAEQAANGTLTYKQRLSLGREANALVQEYNRIVYSTSFNGINLLDVGPNASALRIQSGYGTTGGVDFNVGFDLRRIVGNGTFQNGLAEGSPGSTESTYLRFGDGSTFNASDYFVMYDESGHSYEVWFNVDAAGSAPGIAENAIEVDISSGNADTEIANLVAAAINLDGRLSATDNTDGSVTINTIGVGAVTDFDPGTLGPGALPSSSILTQGANASGASGMYATGTSPQQIKTGDFNDDGILDLVTTNTTGVSILYGNGDGTFGAARSLAAGGSGVDVEVADMNNDGLADIVAATGSGYIKIFLSNGNGTFRTGITVTTGSSNNDIAVGDLNNDGINDIIGYSGSTRVVVALGNGNGTFAASKSYNSNSTSGPQGVSMGDINGDGIADIVAAETSGAGLAVWIGNGDGTFQSAYTISHTNSYRIIMTDINNDGKLDVVTGNTGTGNGISVRLGNGNGTFGSENLLAFGSSPTLYDVRAGDLNGDGKLDLFANDNSTTLFVFLGNGNGTFATRATFSVGNGARGVTFGDFNRDGAVDIATADLSSSTSTVLLANTQRGTTAIDGINISTKGYARQALEILNTQLNRITAEFGNLGSYQRRLESTLRTVSSTRDNYIGAKSQITDVDVASETATLTRATILQQSNAALLGQANLRSEIALGLLKDL